MNVEQFVMAYGVEQDRLRALLPDGFSSLRPVLRINAEVRDGKSGYVELNTAVEKDGTKGWLNVGYWTDVPFEQDGNTTMFKTEFLEISFTGVGIEGSCPAEKDNAGCFFLGEEETMKKPERITANKEFSIAALHGSSPKMMLTERASEKRFQPIRQRSKPFIRGSAFR